MAARTTIASMIAAGVAPARAGRGFRATLSSWLGVPIKLTDGDFWRAFSGAGTFLNRRVTVDQALQLATVWACVRLIAETIATLPIGLYRRLPDGSRTSASNHNLYELLHNQPNADMTAVVFWEVVVASLLLWGNAWIEVVRGGGQVIALLFLHPARVVARRLRDGSFEYRYRETATGVERVIDQASMMHIPAFTLDGAMGVSPIVYGANVFGTAIATDKASAETFNSSLRSPGVITMDMVFKKEQREEIRKHVQTVSDEGGVMVLEKGASFQKLGFDPESAELLNSRQWNVEEMCRWYRVDPAMIGHGQKDSNWGTGLEQKMIWFVTFTLRHWCVRIEQAIRKNLLTAAERGTYYAEFALEGLLRADSASRAAFYSVMTQNGIMKRDECRALENLSPEGGNAAVLTVQSNMLPIDKLGAQQAPADAGAARDALLAWLGINPNGKELTR